MIQIDTLKESDKDREVRYTTFGKTEYGRITSWNDKYIFVRYHLAIEGKERRPRYGTTSEATSPEDLEFCA
jgi:hypothetical protein